MNLSMWIIKECLGDLIKESHITNGKMTIKSIRLFSSEITLEKSLLLIGARSDFFHDAQELIVCKNQDDYLVLNTTELSVAVNKIQDIFGFFNDWNSQCRNVISSNGTLDDLLDLSLEIFPTPIVVVDGAQKLIALSKQKAAFLENEDWIAAMKRGSISDETLKKFNLDHPDVYTYKHVFPVDPEYFFVKGFCKHLFIDGSRRASVILKSPGEDYSTGKLQIFNYYTEIIKEWINACGDDDSTFRIRSYLAHALAGEADSIHDMIRQTTLFGWDENCSKILFLISPTRESHPFDMYMISNLTHEAEGTYAMIYKNCVVILANNDILNLSVFSTALQTFLSDRHCYGAVSFPFKEMSRLNLAYEMTLSAIESNPNVAGVIYHCEDMALRRAAHILQKEAATTLLHPALALLKDYDRKNKTDFYATLFCFLKNEQRNQETAAELFIHRNTLFQRLQKIQDIWPIDLKNPDERFLLLFSFYCEKYFE